MFCGLCGNGKTTWAKALQLLVSGLNLKNPINNLYYVFPLWNAKDLAMRSKGNYNDWRNVMRYQLMIVDDLGTEPRLVIYEFIYKEKKFQLFLFILHNIL